MAYLNANIPVIECWVRGNYLRDQKDSHDKYFEVGVFGFSSIPNRVPMFHFLMKMVAYGGEHLSQLSVPSLE